VAQSAGSGGAGHFQVEALQIGLWMQAQLQQAYWAGYQAGQSASVSGWVQPPAAAFNPTVHSKSTSVADFNGPVNGPLAHLFMQSGATGVSRDAA
jgi:hypothetical protein